MKQPSLLVILLLTACCGSGQVHVGLFGGGQLSRAHYLIFDRNVNKFPQETRWKYGFQAGAMLRTELERRLHFAPSIFVSRKGFDVTLDRPAFPPDTSAIANDVTLYTLEVAPLMQYYLSDEEGVRVFIKGGPSFDLQVSGRETYTTRNGQRIARKMKFSYSDYSFMAMNLLVHFGIETPGGWVIFAQYTHGIGGIVNTDSGPRIFHRAAGLSIGKYF
jgi:hypothetical protein